MPVPFYITVAKPRDGSAGEIAEAWFVVKGKELALSDASGDPIGEWRPIEGPGELYTARRALRSKMAARRGTPDHSPIVYPKVGWR